MILGAARASVRAAEQHVAAAERRAQAEIDEGAAERYDHEKVNNRRYDPLHVRACRYASVPSDWSLPWRETCFSERHYSPD
jgi:hypothetical protein